MRKGERTRRRILEAARAVFGEAGYECATIRGIAAAAGVDKSSVTQYFGTKRNLFAEAVRWTVPVDRLVGATPGETADNLMAGMLSAWARDPNGPMAILVRASMTSEDAAAILREHVTEHIVAAVAETFGDDPDARLRAALLSAVMLGLASSRYLLRMPDLDGVDDDEIVRLLSPALRSLADSATPPAKPPRERKR
ncbi:TetR family transcriptional regulator [Mycobacterium sp.]|uniref:TetR/AcrR family transcriptional regulator n=1 Tax=Mycobacterium sp. TaxID=1785 RepID=UPI003A88E494